MKYVTLLFLRREDQLLLAMKKRGFGQGRWNGVGGKTEPGETLRRAAIRECQEEIGVTPLNPQQVGYLQFLMPDDPEFEHRTYVFVATKWEGEPIETEEMRPQWFDVANIPYPNMWPDDPLWLPHLLAGKKFEGIMSGDGVKVLEYGIRMVNHVRGGDLRSLFKQNSAKQNNALS